MPIVSSPYDQRIANIRKRIKKQSDPRVRQHTREQLQKFRGKQYFSQQRNRPPAPLPYSGAYETTVSGLEKTRDQQLSDIAGRRLATQQQYGFEDQSNPFARAAMLQRDYQQQQARTLGSYARSGQLYAGSLSRATDADRFGLERGLDEALREYQAELGGLTGEELKVKTGFEEDLREADVRRLEEAAKQRPTPEEAPGRPKAAQDLLKQLQQRAQKLQKHGKKRKATKIRERIQRFKDTPYG